MTSFLFHLHFIFRNDTIKMRKLNIEKTACVSVAGGFFFAFYVREEFFTMMCNGNRYSQASIFVKR